MGHLTRRSQCYESEREVQLGNAAAVASSSLAGMFDYLALDTSKPQQFDQGKIHTAAPQFPQFLRKERYQMVVMIEVDGSELTLQNLKFRIRKLVKKVAGNR